MLLDPFFHEFKKIIEQTEISNETSIEDLDSMKRMEVSLHAEGCLKVDLSDKEIKACKTYGDLRELIDFKQTSTHD